MDTKFVNIYWQHRDLFSKIHLLLLRLVSISRCKISVPTALTICPSPGLTFLGLSSSSNTIATSSTTYGRSLQNLSPMLVLVGDYHVGQRFKLLCLGEAWCHVSWCGRWTIIVSVPRWVWTISCNMFNVTTDKIKHPRASGIYRRFPVEFIGIFVDSMFSPWVCMVTEGQMDQIFMQLWIISLFL